MAEKIKIRRHIVVLLTFLLLVASVAQGAKREMRGVWLATVWCLDWPGERGCTPDVIDRQKQQMRQMLDSYESQNFTSVFFQVRGMADALYPSRLSPWSAFVSGERGVSPGWDPLAFVVEECHRRGLECYAWINPFRWSSGTDFNTARDREWKQRGWLLKHGKYTVLNPGLEPVREHIVDICRELVEGYEIDGLVFDDYFYPNRIPETSEAGDYTLWQREAPWMTIGDWRRANIHKTIADVHTMIADTRPEVRFGVSPAGVTARSKDAARKWGAECVDIKADDWQYSEIYSEPLAWLYQGTVDFISPQIYWPTTHATAPFGPLAQWWSRMANDYGCHFYGSITLEALAKDESPAMLREVGEQIKITRNSGTGESNGVVIYAAKNLHKLKGELGRKSFIGKSLSPELRRESGVAVADELPESPADITLTNGILKWKRGGRGSVERSMNPQRYAVYAFPRHLPREDVYSLDGDGIDGRWLLRVVYGNELLVADKSLNYAVTALTGYSSESSPAFLR